jgi:rod shape-determining protein MreD
VRSFLALVATAAVAMLIETAVVPAVVDAGMGPDLVLVLAVYLGSRHREIGGAVGAFLLGWFLDTFAGSRLGMHAFALTAVYGTVLVVARKLWMKGGVPVMVVAGLAVGVQAVALLAMGTMVGDAAPVWWHLRRYGLVQAALTVLAAPLVFGAVAWEKRVLGVSA